MCFFIEQRKEQQKQEKKPKDRFVYKFIPVFNFKGGVIIYDGGWYRREMFFVVKMSQNQQLKSQKKFYPASNIN